LVCRSEIGDQETHRYRVVVLTALRRISMASKEKI
jgi:hypothetical protein